MNLLAFLRVFCAFARCSVFILYYFVKEHKGGIDCEKGHFFRKPLVCPVFI